MKNFALLELHADEVRPPSAGDWLFVAAIIASVLMIAAVPAVVLYWIGSLLRRGF